MLNGTDRARLALAQEWLVRTIEKVEPGTTVELAIRRDRDGRLRVLTRKIVLDGQPQEASDSVSP